MKNKFTLPGIIITFMASLFFVLSIYLWSSIDLEKKNILSKEELLQNEIEAFYTMQRIITAQSKFYEEDSNLSGSKDYAEFLPHLYIYAGKSIEPVKLGLITEEVAYSKSSLNGFKGYIFKTLPFIDSLVYKDLWSVTGIPKKLNITGRLTYITNQNNVIFSKLNVYNLKNYPLYPEKEGWIKTNTEKDIRTIFY